MERYIYISRAVGGRYYWEIIAPDGHTVASRIESLLDAEIIAQALNEWAERQGN